MTVYIDPVIGAAVVHLGLPILPALPCPTCGGEKWVPVTDNVRELCPDCTDGVWTPPDHPVPIGVTSATADAMLDQDERMHEAGYDIGIISDQRSGWELATRPPGEEWTSGNTIKHPIVLSSMIGEATLRALKVVDFRSRIDGLPGVVEITHGSERRGLRHWFKTTDGIWDWADISSARPFLPGLKPDDTVYLLDGFTASVECTKGGLSRLSCPFPTDAPDHPCVQP